MILYHGTNQDIESIDLTKGLRHKDFGMGFYVTPDKTTAIRMAEKKARLLSPMNQPTHHQIATYLTDYVLSELVKYVMEDTGCSIEQAMERVYNSPLMSALQDEEGELYVQSPAYLYELMNQKD